MNDWAYWLKKCVERSTPYLFVGFLIWCVCKYAVSGGAWFIIALLVLSEQKSKGYQGASGGIQEQFIPLLLPRFRKWKWVRIKSLLYFKRRRKSKRKRKRKRG